MFQCNTFIVCVNPISQDNYIYHVIVVIEVWDDKNSKIGQNLGRDSFNYT